MDELELWMDDRRPPPHLIANWTAQWREGSLIAPPEIAKKIQIQYDAHRRADMDDSIRTANLAHRAISESIVNGTFDKDLSGALQHEGQFIAIGTEKRTQTYDPRPVGDGVQVAPTFVLMPPPERRALPEAVIEAEVRELGR